uniref:Uncharacterized protein n=1 Tax=Rhizophora mucronata TaxID=61149 RepID=A0A2P2IMK4_RHIMU
MESNKKEIITTITSSSSSSSFLPILYVSPSRHRCYYHSLFGRNSAYPNSYLNLNLTPSNFSLLRNSLSLYSLRLFSPSLLSAFSFWVCFASLLW